MVKIVIDYDAKKVNSTPKMVYIGNDNVEAKDAFEKAALKTKGYVEFHNIGLAVKRKFGVKKAPSTKAKSK